RRAWDSPPCVTGSARHGRTPCPRFSVHYTAWHGRRTCSVCSARVRSSLGQTAWVAVHAMPLVELDAVGHRAAHRPGRRIQEQLVDIAPTTVLARLQGLA